MLFNHSYLDQDSSICCTHVKEISGTRLLISLHHAATQSANIEVFDLAKKGRSEKIYSFGEVTGRKFATSNHSNSSFHYQFIQNYIENNNFFMTIDMGYGDLTYNTKRSLLGAISLSGKTAYHLFTVDTNCLSIKDCIKLTRKSKWHSQFGKKKGKFNIFLIYVLNSFLK